MRFIDAIRAYLGRPRPSDPAEWHPWEPFVPVRLVDGSMSNGYAQVWRRRHEGRWEYRQDPMTGDDEWFSRIR